MDTKKIKDLIDLMEKRNLVEVEIREGTKSIHLKRFVPGMAETPNMTMRTGAPQAAAPVSAKPAAPASAVRTGHTITSPFVGTFYRSPSPSEPPFVTAGARVRKGQTLCILEAMKLMNEIESDIDGTVREILIENATPVEFGEALFVIDPS